jgi:hypothetical protein
MMAIFLSDYHLPDEYVDSAISFDDETSENPKLPYAKDILTSILSLNWPRSDKEDAKGDSHVMNDLNECHLPGVEASVLCYYDDDSEMSESEEPRSAKDLLRYIVPIRWLRCKDDSTKKLPEERFVTSDMALNECHLPDEYVDAMVSYDSSGREESSPVEDLIGSVITFPWLGSNDSATEKYRPVMNDISLNDCDPSERSNDLSAKSVKFKFEETTSAEPSPSLHRPMESLAKIISADPKANESIRNFKLAWFFPDEASKAKKDDAYDPKKSPITGVGVGKDPVEALFPSANVWRGALRRRTSTQSMSGSSQ